SGRSVAWVPALGMAFSNSLRALAGVWLFAAISKEQRFLGHFSEMAAITGAALLSPLAGAVIGTPLLILGGTFPAGQWGLVFSRWWIGDGLGILIITPVLVGLAKGVVGLSPFRGQGLLGKTLLAVVAVAAVCYFVFFQPENAYLLFSVFLLILASAAWAGPPAARVSALIIASAAVWATHNGMGAFAGGTVRENLQNLNLFLAAVSLTGLAVGAFRSTGSLLLPGTVLVAGWVLSGWLYASLERERVGYDQARFDKVVNVVEGGMKARLATYEDALRGAAGFLAASPHANASDWHTYVSALALLNRYPGTTGIEFIRYVPGEQLDRFVAARRREGFSDFRVRPYPRTQFSTDPQADHFVTDFVEPAPLAAVAVGADIGTQTQRRAAAERARDTGHATLTRTIRFNSGDTPQNGFMLFVPVYGKELAPAASEQERRAALIGWTAVAFTADAFFQSALATVRESVLLRAYDESVPSGRAMFASDDPGNPDPQFERTTKLNMAGASWTLGWKRTPQFPNLSKTPSAWAAGCAALLSLLIAGLVVNLQSTGQRASALAEERTRELAKAVKAADAANRAKSEFLANMSHEI